MIRCEMGGCTDMADVVAEYLHIVYGKQYYDFCKSCVNYIREDLGKILKITPYANKGLRLPL
jgi:hypothetical protein